MRLPAILVLAAGTIAGVLTAAAPYVSDPVPEIGVTQAASVPRHVDPTSTPEAQAYLTALREEHLKPMNLTDLVTVGFGVCVWRKPPYNLSHSTAAVRLAESRKDISKIDAATIVNEADKFLCP